MQNKTKTIPKGWKEEIFGDLIIENKKSKIKAGEASNRHKYKFFTSGDKVLTHNDFLVDKENIFLSTGGRASIKYFNGRSSYSTDTYSIKTNEKIFTKYFYYFLLSKVGYIDRNLFIGSGLKHLQKKDFKKLKLLAPPLDEQNKIAEILSVVDEDIEKTDQVIEKIEKMKKGLMWDLLTGRVRVPLSFRAERSGERNPLNVVSGKDDDNPHSRDSSLSVGMTKKTELGEIPEGWEVKNLINVATLQRGFDLPIQDRTYGKYPLATSNGITDYHSEYKVLAPGVFTGRSGTIGNVFYIEKNYWPHNTTLYVKDFHGNNEKFIYYFLQKFNLKNFYSGTGVPTLNRNIVHKEKVTIPKSKKEQKQIAEILSSVDNKIDINKQIKNKLIQLKKGLMQDLLSGRVRVK